VVSRTTSLPGIAIREGGALAARVRSRGAPLTGERTPTAWFETVGPR